jgi:hypothetical protein
MESIGRGPAHAREIRRHGYYTLLKVDTRSFMAGTIEGTNRETPVMSTSEILLGLRQLRDDLAQHPVISWLRWKENPHDIAEAVALMAEIADALYGEIDLFIGSMDLTEDGEPGRRDPDVELVDLQGESEAEPPLEGFLS